MTSAEDGLRDDPWERVKDLLPGGRKGKRGPRSQNRLFLDAILWFARSGGHWKDLPERFGQSDTLKRRYYRLVDRGGFAQILDRLAQDADLEWLMINSTSVRDHHRAAGARLTKGGRLPRGCAGLAAA